MHRTPIIHSYPFFNNCAIPSFPTLRLHTTIETPRVVHSLCVQYSARFGVYIELAYQKPAEKLPKEWSRIEQAFLVFFICWSLSDDLKWNWQRSYSANACVTSTFKISWRHYQKRMGSLFSVVCRIVYASKTIHAYEYKTDGQCIKTNELSQNSSFVRLNYFCLFSFSKSSSFQSIFPHQFSPASCSLLTLNTNYSSLCHCSSFSNKRLNLSNTPRTRIDIWNMYVFSTKKNKYYSIIQ